MDLIESLNKAGNVRGITLNSQQIDLFNLIEKENATDEIYKYLTDILMADKMSFKGMSTKEKINQIINEKSSVQDKDKFKSFIIENAAQIRSNWGSKEQLQKAFDGMEIESEYIDEIFDMKKYFTYQTHGILSFLVDQDGNTIDTAKDYDEILQEIDKERTMQKIGALKEYIVSNIENNQQRFNRLTLDGQGKFGTVAGLVRTENEENSRPEDYNLKPLRDGYEFARQNGMDIRINALVFFKDFPDRLVGGSKKEYKTALVNYGKAVATIVNEYQKQGISTTIDMFNEFVDYNEPYNVRTNNWMSKLSIKEMCEIAMVLKQEMPDADFGYNDWNFENPDKRKTIFEVLGQIQSFEKENNCKIITHIGTQCHTSINDIDGLKQSIEELQKFGLPVDITELDISKGLSGVNYESATSEELVAIRKYEQKLQNDIMKYLSECVKEGKIRSITSWSITDELCCDFCDGKEASVTGMIFDKEKGFVFFGKDMDTEIEITPEELKLIQEHKNRIKEQQKEKEIQQPIQDFSYHNHTQRCGHAAKDTGDIEFVENAIKGGIKKLAFTDHIPMPEGLNKIPNSRMDIAEVDSYLKSIEYLKNKFAEQIEIESGFEFEYTRDYKGVNYLEFLKEMESKTDKMVLGQHWVVDSDGIQHDITRGKGGKQIDDKVLKLYADSICEAIDEGLPDIIAHPDLFMKARDEFGDLEKQITRQICEKSIEKGIPLEINFGEISKYSESEVLSEQEKAKISYPSKEFWNFVSDNYGDKLKVIFGKDSHFPEQLSTQRDYEIAMDIVGTDTLSKLQFVKEDLKAPDVSMSDKIMQHNRERNSTKNLEEQNGNRIIENGLELNDMSKKKSWLQRVVDKIKSIFPKQEKGKSMPNVDNSEVNTKNQFVESLRVDVNDNQSINNVENPYKKIDIGPKER